MSYRFILALQVCYRPPPHLYRQIFPEPSDKHSRAIRLTVGRRKVDGRDRAWVNRGGQSGVWNERIYIDALAGVHWQDCSLSCAMLGSDSNEAILGREAPHARVFAEMEDGRQMLCYLDVN